MVIPSVGTCPAPVVLVRWGFLYGRLLRSKICVVKITGRIGGFSAGKKTNQQLFRAPFFYRVFLYVFSLFPVVSYVWKSAIYFRIGTPRVLLSQILNSTTSDTRQDGQSSPFTASSSQRVRGMRKCRASIVAETEKPFLVEHQRLYPLLFAFLIQEKIHRIVLIAVRFKIVPSWRRKQLASA